MQELRCKKCGSLLEKRGEMYICPACGAQYETENARRNAEELLRILDEQKQETVANLRAQLWRETQEEYINDTEISRLAKEVKRYLPDDYFANFCALACGNNNARLNAFLGKTDVSEQRMFVWDVLRLMLHLLKEDNLLAVNDFLSRVGNDCDDTEMYDRYNRQLIREAEKIDKGVYDVQLPRDAFIAYKSEDMGKVIGLVEELERQGLKCFVAARNLQHGAMRHYEEKLYEAMDHCKVVVFVSSTRSRSRRCDALSVELAYIRQKDVEAAPAKYRNYYEKMPPEYKKPRVEYVIEAYKGGDAAEEIVDEFFAGYERCFNEQEVARRVLEYVASAPVSNVKYCVACGAENGKKAKFCSECGGREFVATSEEREEKQREQAERAIREAEAVRKAEEDRRRAEEEKKKAEAEAEALRAELKRLKTAAAKSALESAVNAPSVHLKSAESESAAQSSPAVQSEPVMKSQPVASSIEDFEIKNGELIKYVGKGGDVVIPQGVKSIWGEAFSGCSGLTGITISREVTGIGAEVFYGCSGLMSITVEQGNSVYHSDGNCLIETQSKKLIAGCKSSTIPSDGSVTRIEAFAFSGCSGLKSITIPNSVTSIGALAFRNCSGLTDITIPHGVKSIEHSSFKGCSALTSIAIPNSVTSIENGAFSGCSGLTSITIPNSVTRIENSAFSGCSGLINITIPNSVTHIEASAFSGCSGLTSITIPNSVTSIESSVFSGCSGLTSVAIPNSVTSIEDNAFDGCRGLKSITIPNSVAYIGQEAFLDCSGLTSITIPSGVTSLESGAFYGCSGLESATIPNSVTSIESSAFEGCSSLTNITIPIGVISIGVSAFSGCSGLLNIIVDRANAVYHSEGNCLIETKSKTLVLGCKNSIIPADGSVTSIGTRSFEGCSGLKSITIPDSVTSIGACAFSGCSSMASLMIPDSVKSIESLAFEGCSSMTSITIPNGVMGIENRVFSGCSGLTSITIPNSVKRIEREAFSGCSGLTSITIPNSVKSIGDRVFWGCSDMTSMAIPNSVKSIGREAFSGCSGLKEITIPTQLEVLGKKAIPAKTKIYCHRQKPTEYPKGWAASYKDRIIWDSKEATFVQSSPAAQSKSAQTKPSIQAKPSVQTQSRPAASPVEDFEIKDGVLVKYKGKGGDVVIPNGVKSIYGAFSFCSGLTSITIPDSVTSIGPRTFEGCSGLTSIAIPNSVKSIGPCAFEGCSGLTSITVEQGNSVYHSDGNCLIKTQSKELIAGCKNSIIPADGSVTSIEESAFKGCSGLTSITIPNGVTSIRYCTFEDCIGLTSVTIPNGVTSIESDAFKGCSSLASITIPNSVTSIGCRQLKIIALPNYTTREEGSAFEGCSGLTNITVEQGNSVYHSDGNCLIKTRSKELILGCKNSIIPADGSVTSIGKRAFKGCSGLTSITIPNGVTSIGWGTFAGCRGLTSITLSNSVTSIEWFAFEGCSNLTSITLPNSVTSIGRSAFSGCSGLTSLTIPNGVTDIGGYAFWKCSAKIYCHRKKPLFWPKGWDKDLKGKIIWDK